MEQKDETQKKGTDTELSIQQAIVLCGVIIAAAIIVGVLIITHALSKGSVASTNTASGSGATSQTAGGINILSVKTTGTPFIGVAKADVGIIYWSDLGSPSAKTFDATTLQQIKQKYVDSGEVAVAFKDLPSGSTASQTLALYERSVWSLYPGEYFPWREAIDNSTQDFSDESAIVAATATVPGIDATKVQADVLAHQASYEALIKGDETEAANLGVTMTPSFLTGDKLITGAAPFSEFQADVDPQILPAQPTQ